MSTKECILKSSFDLFLRDGIGESSANEAIKFSGVTKGCFYHHFSGKEELISEVINKYICPFFEKPVERLKQKINEDRNLSDPREKLWFCYSLSPDFNEFGDLYSGIENLNMRNFFFLVYECMKRYPYLSNLRCRCSREMIELTAQVIEECKNFGIVKSNTNSQSIATAMFALKDGMQALNFIDSEIKLIDKFEFTFGHIWNEIQAKEGGQHLVG